MMIAGATGGVGAALTRLAVEAGWSVVGLHRREGAHVEELKSSLGAAGDALRLLPCDLADAAEIDKLLAGLEESYCPDALVHLAAAPLDIQPLARIEWAEFQRQIDGTLKPVVLLTRPLLKRIAKRGSGRVIAALSAVVLGTPPRGFAAYAAAKHALAGYMKCLAAEYAERGVAANMVSPGPMKTALLRNLPALMVDQLRAANPGGRWIDPVVVARSILWLAGEAGPEITACNLPITSGEAGE